MNTIGVIAPYKYEGLWVFDDPAVGLVREPFVAGIDTMIDQLVTSIPHAEPGFQLLFSATAFPGYTVKLEWRREESDGNWYFARSSESRVGSALRSSGISTGLQPNCMLGPSQRPSDLVSSSSAGALICL